MSIDPICVSCHLCHAQCGQGCNWGVTEDEPFCDRRVTRAKTLSALRDKDPASWAATNRDVEHTIARGQLCAPVYHGICYTCGQTVACIKETVSLSSCI
jgi:hypothetical protein